MNILGECLVTGMSGAPSPWFERLGDAATFRYDVAGISSATRLQVVIETKNCDLDDSKAAVLGTMTATAVGVRSLRVSGLQEWVRFKYTVDFYKSPHADSGFVHFAMLPPAWENNCKCSCDNE